MEKLKVLKDKKFDTREQLSEKLGTILAKDELDRFRVLILNHTNETAASVPTAITTPQLIKGSGKPANLPGSWTCFRGAAHDNVSQDKTPLARKWPSGGPKVLWSVALGLGYAGPVVHEGRVYLLDYDVNASADALRCLSLEDGQEIWRYAYPVAIKEYHGMSRTVPAVAEGHVVALGPKCHVTCVDVVTGERQWGIDLVAEYGTKPPEWYAGQCPLIDGSRVVLAPGGKDALLLAVDLKTGKPLWKTPNPRSWQMTHASVMPLTVNNRKMYVYCASGGVVGVDAETGALLWQTTDWPIRDVVVPSPVCLPDGRIFLSGGYGAWIAHVESQRGRRSISGQDSLSLPAEQIWLDATDADSVRQSSLRYPRG